MDYKILLILAVFAFVPRAGMAFDWPANVTAKQKSQVLLQEVKNLKTLALSAKSTKKNSAQAYMAVDLSNNKVLLKKNPDQVHSIASVTKLMNAVVVAENIDGDKKITLTKKMLLPFGSSPTIFAGLNISAKNLLQASLTQSVNDAAESLSFFLGKDKFVGLMNKKAKELGMTKTVFADTNGLNVLSRSTAADLGKLLDYVYKKHPDILKMTKNNDFWLPDAKGQSYKFQNMNDFYSYAGFIGGKTGYLPEAGHSFAALFEINKKPVAIVLLHSTNYQADTFKIINQLKN